jgi:methyl-accepting chemotaxis protein
MMMKTLEFWGTPAIAIYRRFDFAALLPLCAAIAVGIGLCGLFAPPLWKGIGISLLMFAGFYVFTGYMFFRRQHLKLSISLLDSAIEGDWQFDQKTANNRWASQGIVPLVIAFGARVNALTMQTAKTADALLLSAQTAAVESNHLSVRAEEIAAMLEESASSLEQFTGSIEMRRAAVRYANSRCKQLRRLTMALIR